MAITQKALLDSVPTGLLIGGRWREASGGERFDVHDPSSGAVLTSCARGCARRAGGVGGHGAAGA